MAMKRRKKRSHRLAGSPKQHAAIENHALHDSIDDFTSVKEAIMEGSCAAALSHWNSGVANFAYYEANRKWAGAKSEVRKDAVARAERAEAIAMAHLTARCLLKNPLKPPKR